jgi:hypothetical protein
MAVTDASERLLRQRRICELQDDSGEVGDSGAPVYEQVGSRDARAVGILSGRSGGCGPIAIGEGVFYSHVRIAAGRLNKRERLHVPPGALRAVGGRP